MKKQLIITLLLICSISAISKGQPPNFSVDMLQNMLFGVSTLKGVEEVYPQVQIEVLEAAATQELRSTSKIGTLARDDIKEQVLQALQKANIKIAQKFDNASENAPLSLNITIFIKIAVGDPPIYNTYIYTEALQSVRLGRDNSIHSLSRTWPIQPMGLTTRNMFVLNSSKLEDTVKEEVNKQVEAFISDFAAANPKPVTVNAKDVDIEALKKTLLEENIQPRYGTIIKKDDPSLQAIKQLEQFGSQEAVDILLKFLINDKMDRKLRQQTLITLGRIGTEPAIEAIGLFEAWSRKRYIIPQPFEMGMKEHAVDHFALFPAQPLAQTKDANNKTWALVPLNRYDWLRLCLTSLEKDSQWSDPILLSIPGMSMPHQVSNTKWKEEYEIQVDGDLFTILSEDKKYECKISEQLIDSDKDGLTDNVEALFLTDPKNPDSDSDRIQDGKDSNPLTPKHRETNDVTEIRQAVFSVLFATTSSKKAVVVIDKDEFAKQEYYGFAGPVLRASEVRDGFANLTAIDIREQSEDAATVWIMDWEGVEAARGREVKLQKIHGKWIVSGFGFMLLS